MSGQDRIRMGYKVWFALGSILLAVLCAYSNTFQSSWHLDDYPNIVNNSPLHLQELTSGSIHKTLFSRPWPSGLYRPVACLTFALNWYVGNEKVYGYHLVNLVIHFLTAFILFLTVVNIYRSPRLARSNPDEAYWIALLTTALWAVNPVQTQAVTYIVQRMALLAAMFYILGVYFYVKGRFCNIRWHRLFYFMACTASYFLAVGSKENAVTLPLALVLAEIAFLQNLECQKTRRAVWVITAFIGFVMILVAAVLLINADTVSILKGYQNRSYTLWQRLMTEPRIVIFYLTQLFYPVPNRLSVEHDVSVSTSFFEPWTTLPVILLVALLIIGGLSQVRKRPILALGTLFFFLNHLIESTVLPLELIFEHRNYLPSLFLFLPVAAALFRLVDHYREKRRLTFVSLVSFIALLVVGLGVSTYIRNTAWATEQTLWYDAIKKAPGSARPAYNLATHYYLKSGQLDIAMQLYQKAAVLNASKPKYSRALSLNGIASIYYIKKDYENVIQFCQKALRVDPGFEVARYNMVLALARLHRWEQASDQIDLLVARRKNNARYLYLKAVILLKLDKPLQAISSFRKAMRISPSDGKILLNIGVALSSLQQYQQAEWFFMRAIQSLPGDIRPYFYLVETGLKAESPLKIERALDKLFAAFNIKTIFFKMNRPMDDLFVIPPSRELIAPVIIDKLTVISNEIAQLGRL